MKSSEKYTDYSSKTPRNGEIHIKSSTTAKKGIEDSESQTPGLKQMKL